jgi:hypothetical protein
MSMFTFMSPIASSMVAPASFQIAQDLHITTSIEVAMTISIYVLAYGECLRDSLMGLCKLNGYSCRPSIPRTFERNIRPLKSTATC